MRSNYQASSENPFHLSVGAVLFDDDGRIAFHYFKDAPIIGGEALILMRETVENDETLESALLRGVMEEFGATANIKRYLGSRITKFQLKDSTEVQKTTLYFHLSLEEFNPKLRSKDDPEANSKIVWLKPDEYLEKIKSIKSKRTINDIDESEIIERIKSIS